MTPRAWLVVEPSGGESLFRDRGRAMSFVQRSHGIIYDLVIDYDAPRDLGPLQTDPDWEAQGVPIDGGDR